MKRLMVFVGVLAVLTAGCSGSHNAASDKSASHKSTSVPNDLAGTSWLKISPPAGNGASGAWPWARTGG